MFVGGKHAPRLPREYARARELRSAGRPIKQIAREVGVSPSSVLRWTSDIELTPQQQSAIDADWQRTVDRRAAAWSERNRERRRIFQEEGRRRAREPDPQHLAGCMLYWAEGAKDRNLIEFANSDEAMMVLFVRFLRESLGVDAGRITLRVNVYTGNGLTLEQIEQHWLDLLELPSSALRTPVENHFPTSSSGRRKRKLLYGVCSVRVSSTELVQHIFGAIQQYCGKDIPGWLDGSPTTRAEREEAA